MFAYRSLCDKCASERRLCPACVKPPEDARLADGDGEPSDGEDGDGDESSDEDLDGVVITHLSDDEGA